MINKFVTFYFYVKIEDGIGNDCCELFLKAKLKYRMIQFKKGKRLN